MKASFRQRIFVAFAVLCVSYGSGQAEQWMHGAVAVTMVEGEPSLVATGATTHGVTLSTALPQYVPGLLKVRTEAGDSVFLTTSNQISIYNEGVGYFAIERFEQDVAESMDSSKSRMIFNFRQGLLAVDNRALSDDSQMIVETPLGRISVKNGWWMMQIDCVERSHIYDFSIECADGVLRFTDLSGDTYTLRNGQRLKGAGASARPSIEVGRMSEDAGEFFEGFAELEGSAADLDLSAEALQAQMQPITMRRSSAETSTAATEIRDSKRPLLIEYAPQSAPVTPYRAVIRPPSSYQADLF